MDRLNHVKIVTPDPAAVDRFLREVVDIPEGWPLGQVGPVPSDVRSPARGPDGEFDAASVGAFRGTMAANGFITGSTASRQFQIFQGERPHIWGAAIGTRNLERAYERCLDRGIPCTVPERARWGDGGINFFFAEVGGIVFEVMRIEESAPEPG